MAHLVSTEAVEDGLDPLSALMGGASLDDGASSSLFGGSAHAAPTAAAASAAATAAVPVPAAAAPPVVMPSAGGSSSLFGDEDLSGLHFRKAGDPVPKKKKKPTAPAATPASDGAAPSAPAAAAAAPEPAKPAETPAEAKARKAAEAKAVEDAKNASSEWRTLMHTDGACARAGVLGIACLRGFVFQWFLILAAAWARSSPLLLPARPLQALVSPWAAPHQRQLPPQHLQI